MAELVPVLSVYLLVFVRVSAFFVTMPLFSYRNIPAQHRIAFSVVLSWVMYYTIDSKAFEINGQYFLLIMKEAMVGLLIGFVAYMIVSAIQIAGGFIDFQMGFAIANVIDPQTGAQSPLTGQYLYTFALLLLLALNGHHLLLDGIFYSYQLIPIDRPWIPFGNENLADYVISAFNSMFVIAFQMSVPVVATLFLVDVALGIVARTVPQLNVFVVGFPIKIAVAFIVLFIVMGVTFAVVQQLFEMMFVTMRDLMKIIGGT
ncbi:MULTISPECIES: flagellar biosynthetic protein FliR [Bacillaceae]|uniref:flagellar biosynthetic protein FliR n=1 Tax=Bacillaceae TaxID=186817 RepID=UPI001C566278|nr:flagellar biosynthetic protein FliR [Rossellomorea sp. YZS02]MBW3113856.1 flagellar type III secretion system protein FliR [Bacillus sp. MCCB 382]MDX8343901.1 flagellar biosynthetic protein FliR [Rossellomorea sp. YZS02]